MACCRAARETSTNPPLKRRQQPGALGSTPGGQMHFPHVFKRQRQAAGTKPGIVQSKRKLLNVFGQSSDWRGVCCVFAHRRSLLVLRSLLPRYLPAAS